MPLRSTLDPPSLEIDLQDLPRPWAWAELFGDDRAVEVEIGTGNGTFLVDAALRSPERGFLGIEVSKKFFSKALRRAARKGAANVRMVFADAAYVLERCVPPSSVDAYHVYFPEPWPKKRHFKRRLFKPRLVSLLAETLRPGGYLLVATDVEEYFEEIEGLIDGESRLERLGELDPPLESARGRATTSYEEKYRAEGRSIRYAGWRRPPEGPAGERKPPSPASQAEAPKEEPMPHVVLERPIALSRYVADFVPLEHREEEMVCKVSEAYLSSNGLEVLLDAVAVDSGRTQRFFVLVSEKPDRATVRILRTTEPEKTRAVKRLLALVARDIASRSPSAAYGATNIEPFLFKD